MPYDDTEFVEREFPPGPSAGRTSAVAAGRGAAPSREDLDAQVTSTQQQLAKLREAQDQLERAKAELEEMRRRRAEFQNGRAEMQDQLTRAVELLGNAEFDARRSAEQMAKSLAGLRHSLEQVQSINEQAWTDSDWTQNLSRALTVIESSRMELNSARLHWPVLDGARATAGAAASPAASLGLADLPTGRLLRLGLALTWPLLVAALAAVVVLALALNRR